MAEIRTRNLPIANPALYHTAASAPTLLTYIDTHKSADVRITLHYKHKMYPVDTEKFTAW